MCVPFPSNKYSKVSQCDLSLRLCKSNMGYAEVLKKGDKKVQSLKKRKKEEKTVVSHNLHKLES